VTVPQQHQWKKSTFSDNSATCVIVRNDLRAVGDDKNPDRPALPVTRTAWAMFMEKVGEGRYDV